MSTHTPGPWRAWDRIEHRGGILITNEQGNIGVCRVIDVQGSINDRTPDTEKLDADICRANACLIAAAPDLLAACKAAQLAFRATSKADKDYGHECGLLRDAIAKAGH